MQFLFFNVSMFWLFLFHSDVMLFANETTLHRIERVYKMPLSWKKLYSVFVLHFLFYFTSYYQWVQKVPPRINATFFFDDSFLALCVRTSTSREVEKLKSDSASKRFRIHSKVGISPRDLVAALLELSMTAAITAAIKEEKRKQAEKDFVQNAPTSEFKVTT